MTTDDDREFANFIEALRDDRELAADIASTEPGIRAVNAAIALAGIGPNPSPATLRTSQALHQLLADTIREHSAPFVASLLDTFQDLIGIAPDALQQVTQSNDEALAIITRLRADGIVP